MSNLGEWQRPTRAAVLNDKIAELQRIRSLIPTEDDFLKYGLTVEEFSAIPLGPRIKGELVIKWQNAINGIMVVLRKRDVEKPEMQIDYVDLRDAISVLINEESSASIAFFVLHNLVNAGLIKGSRGEYGFISIVEPKIEIEGVMSAPF